jgi:TPR repeat protein
MLLIKDEAVDLRFEGVAYLMRAAKMGDASAAELLAREFQQRGSEYKELIDSVYWFRKAIDSGSATAYLSLSRQLAASADVDSITEAVAWAIVACRRAPLSTVHRTNACDWQMELKNRIPDQQYLRATELSEALLGGQ